MVTKGLKVKLNRLTNILNRVFFARPLAHTAGQTGNLGDP